MRHWNWIVRRLARRHVARVLCAAFETGLIRSELLHQLDHALHECDTSGRDSMRALREKMLRWRNGAPEPAPEVTP